ncbi:hypothetical protein EZV62_016824 [Acer yangbiense]|uniref:Uncharacterized protein n=1 Tax=Acer yangbiense TaxID=1000413 RepID=A0A5C7HQF3_9ROSI|nr:hypothetical protein EZV62_016824 [Acer yangbiense]
MSSRRPRSLAVFKLLENVCSVLGTWLGIFQVTAFGVRALDSGYNYTSYIDPALMANLAKIATAEVISSKELNADWQRAAAGLLVSIGSHLPDLVSLLPLPHLYLYYNKFKHDSRSYALLSTAIFRVLLFRNLHLQYDGRNISLFSGPNSALPAMVQTLADFASADVHSSTKGCTVMSSTNTWKCARCTLANICKWSFLNSAFGLLFRVWATSRDLKDKRHMYTLMAIYITFNGVCSLYICLDEWLWLHLFALRKSTVEALGQKVGLITRTQLRSALPRLVPTILEL